METEKYEIDPADFCPDKVDDAVHDSLAPINYEWWYFDAAFDNGYSMASLWQMSSEETGGGIVKKRWIDYSIYDPNGKKVMVKKPFDISDVFISSETCDVKMGDNRIYGYPPRYKMHFLADGLGGELEFENLVQGYRSPPDGTAYFSMNPLVYMGWTIAQPRATVKGKITVNGKEMNVKGTGYHDHNWGNTAFNDLYDYWYWGRIFLPGHTIIYSLSQLGEYMEHVVLNLVIAFEGDKLVDMSQELVGEPSDFIKDKETGIDYPRKLVIKINSDVIKGEVACSLKNVIESYPLSVGHPLKNIEQTAYGHGAVRYLSDCDVNLLIKGKKVRHRTELIHEFVKP